MPHNSRNYLLEDMPKPIKKLLAIIFFIIFIIFIGGILLLKEYSGLFAILSILFMPLFLLSFSFLSSNPKVHQRGIFSGLTLFFLGCILILLSMFIRGLNFGHKIVLITLAMGCFSLAKKRWRIKHKNRKRFY